MVIINKLLVVRPIFSVVVLLTSPFCFGDAAQVSKELGRQLIHAEIVGKSENFERSESSNRSSENQTLALNSNKLVSSRSRLDMQNLRFNQSQMLSRNMTRMQDLRFNQSQMLSRNMTRMQDLRFNQSQMLSRNMTRMQDLRFNQSQMLSRNMTRMQDRFATRAIHSLANPRDQFTSIKAQRALVKVRGWMIDAGGMVAGRLPLSMPLRAAQLSRRVKRVYGRLEPGNVLIFKRPQTVTNNSDMFTSIKKHHNILKVNELETIQKNWNAMRDKTHKSPVYKYGNRQLGVVRGTYQWSARKQYNSGKLNKYMSGRSTTTIQRDNRHRIQAPVFDYRLWSRTRL